MKGEVNRILYAKGFGFITDEDGVNRFMHVRGLRNESDWQHLRVGHKVEFEPVSHNDRLGKPKQHNGLSVTDVRRCSN